MLKIELAANLIDGEYKCHGGILLFALIPTLIVATIYNKVLYKLTGNVYTGVFLNTFLMTMITVANTTLYHGLG